MTFNPGDQVKITMLLGDPTRVGDVHYGTLVTPPEEGFPVRLDRTKKNTRESPGCWTTSTVRSIVAVDGFENIIFRTKNSSYKLEKAETEEISWAPQT